jgi:hypothetical protein
MRASFRVTNCGNFEEKEEGKLEVDMDSHLDESSKCSIDQEQDAWVVLELS